MAEIAVRMKEVAEAKARQAAVYAKVARFSLDELSYAIATSDLDKRERKVFDLRFGLSGQQPLSLEGTGKLLNLSRERIRGIELEAVEKMITAKVRMKRMAPATEEVSRVSYKGT